MTTTTSAEPPAMTALVELEGASFSYGTGVIVRDVDLRVETGELVGLVGPSGAGKTTVLRAMLGQLRPVRGRARLRGRPVGRRPPRIGYVPQLETIDWSFPVTVTEAVLMGRAAESGPWPWARPRDRHDVAELLDQLGIADLARRHIRDLSGGQQQRVFLARALVRRPELLLLDEPTSGVDVRTRQEILRLVRDLNGQGVTVVLATHDLNAVATTLPRLICVNGRIVADGRAEEVFTPAVLRATFGSEMVVFSHDGVLLTADVPAHAVEHPHHVHLHHGPAHAETLARAARVAG